MTDIPLYDEDEEIPVPVAKADVRITEAMARPHPDGRRVRLDFKLTPFLERPSVDIAVQNLMGDVVATLSLIEAMDTEFEFTVHLRGPEPRGEHTVHFTLFYPENDAEPVASRRVVSEHALTFHIAPPA
jgi:hypothetical protein